MSVPRPASAIPAAVAAAGPELDPPVMRAGSKGLQQSPRCGLRPSIPAANSFVLPLPITIAPASRSRATAVASRPGSRRQAFEPAVVAIPSTSITSLTQIGMPASGSGSALASAARAAARAPSASTSSQAFISGSRASIRASVASISSTAESRRPSSSARAAAIVVGRSGIASA